MAIQCSDLTAGDTSGRFRMLIRYKNGYFYDANSVFNSEVAFGPAPVTVFDDEAGIGRQNKIACVPGDGLLRTFLTS